MNSEKIKKDLRWEPKVLFKEGIKLTIEWYIQNLEWVQKKEKKIRKYWDLIYS
jgi:dTDP-glucose 4,6-dehydratase